MAAVKESFGGRIRRLRKARGWTQDRLGEVANLDQSTISQIELDKGERTMLTVRRLAGAFGADPHEFAQCAGLLPAAPDDLAGHRPHGAATLLAVAETPAVVAARLTAARAFVAATPAAQLAALSGLPGLPDMTDPANVATVIAYVERNPGRGFHERLEIQRHRREAASYARLCVNIFRAWCSNEDLGLTGYEEHAAGLHE